MLKRVRFLSNSLFLKLGSAKVCQGFRETKMRNGGRVFVGGPKFVYELKFVWRHSTLIIRHW